MKEPMKEVLARILREHGLVSGGRLAKQLGISRSYLSRLLSTHTPGNLVRFGQTRGARYGLARDIRWVEREIPLYRIDAAGKVVPEGRLIPLHGSSYVVEPGTFKYEGLPPELSDMRPQGFIGRAFSQRFSEELGVPVRLQDWSNDHSLIAIANRGEDLPGSVVVGKRSMERWRENQPPAVQRTRYCELADAALDGEPAGSSAGGEQPKFSAFVDGKHFLVKFAGTTQSETDRRWRDLLVCEHLALELLGESGMIVAKTSILEEEGIIFLEVERFDRVGRQGRKAVLTLAAIDDYLIGSRNSWSETTRRLEGMNRISKEDAHRVFLLEAFAMLIADTDRHFHNLAFFPESQETLYSSRVNYRLAPIYDKLPMFFAPTAAKVRKKEFTPPYPSAYLIDSWKKATRLALEFWDRVSSDGRISSLFRELAGDCRLKLQSH